MCLLSTAFFLGWLVHFWLEYHSEYDILTIAEKIQASSADPWLELFYELELFLFIYGRS